MKLLEAPPPAARPKPFVQRLVATATADHRDVGLERARHHFPVDLFFTGIVLLADNGMTAIEFSTFGAACVASVLLAMCLFPVGVLLQHYGARKQSWPLSIGVAAGVCTLMAIPTSLGTMIPGAIALIGHVLSSVRAVAGRNVTNNED